jgi:hypothetical protein
MPMRRGVEAAKAADAAEQDTATEISETGDITWAMMTGAGLNISNIHLVPTGLGTDEYILIDGDTKIAFGPSVDVEDGGPSLGWSLSDYEQLHGADGETDWEQLGEYWEPNSRAALARVRALLNTTEDNRP